MLIKPDTSIKGSALRTEGEKLLQATKRDMAAMLIKDLQQLVYELQVFQTELDLQNDELRQTHIELEAVRDQYADPYDFSPAGLLMLDSSGAVVHANRQAGTLLGVNWQELIGQTLLRLVEPEDQPVFQPHCEEVMKTGTRHTCEVWCQTWSGFRAAGSISRVSRRTPSRRILPIGGR